MLSYLKYLFQLLLSPSNGWEDVRDSAPEPGVLLRRGFYPLLAVVAVAEFVGLLYNKGFTAEVLLIRAIIDLGAYFVSLYLARILLEMYIPPMMARLAPEELRGRVLTLILLALGEMLIFRLICNLLQADVTIIKFLPLYVVLILYKGRDYVGVPADSTMNFTCLTSLAIVLIPLILHYLLSLILL